MRSLSVVVVASLALGLTGCVQGAPPSDPSPTPTAAAFFDSDEEALAAAEKAYREYVRVARRLIHDGSVPLADLDEVTTADFREVERRAIELVRADGLRIEGDPVIVWVTLQSYEHDGTVVIYLCESVADVSVFDALGQSLVEPDRPSESTLEATLVPVDSTLRVSARKLWSESC